MAVNHVKLTADQETRLSSWLSVSLETIRERRINRTRRWKDWREQYEGRVQKQKNFPWKNASNVYVPLTAIYTDAIHANMMNRIFGHERIWDITATHPKEVIGQDMVSAQPLTWVDLAKSVEKFINFEGGQQGNSDVYNTVEQAILECIKLGTAIVYQPWITLTQPDFSLDHATGEIIRGEEQIVYDGVKPQQLALEDFLILPHYDEIHGPNASPLVGHRYWLRKGEILNRRAAGWYRNHEVVDKVLRHPGMGDDEEDVKDHQAFLEGDPDVMSDLRNEDYHLSDLWIKFPLMKNEREVHLFITYHKATGTVMRCQPWIYKTPPYTAFRYVRREKRFYGIGVAEMLESIQHGVNTSFNQSVDNATIANTRVFKVKRNSTLARSMGQIFPGKKVYVDNMDDVDAFQLGEVYPSIFQVGLLLRDFSERRVGVSDFNLGRESEVLGRASTATTTMALLQESSRRFDLYSKDIRRGLGEMGIQHLELFQQFRPEERFLEVLGPQDGELVQRALALPQAINLRNHLIVQATSAASSSNKEVSRQNALTAFGMLSQYLERVFQLAAMISNPQVPPGLRKVAYDMSQTGEKLMQRVLESFDLPDISVMLPQLEGLLAQATSTQPVQSGGMAGPPGGPNGQEGLPPGGDAGPGGDPFGGLG